MTAEASAPLVSVVLATHDRCDRLRQLLDSLERQALAPERFEVVIVDDASSDGTPALLSERERRGTLRLRVLRHEDSRGPAGARNAGWRAATAPLIAFTDDDCIADPRWLEAALAVHEADRSAVIQGRTDPNPAEQRIQGPLAHTVQIHVLGPSYETCNIFYPRELLDRLGGFDEESFSMPGGEDTDLAWKAIDLGRSTRWAEDARVWHAVTWLGPIGKVRMAWRWHETMLVFKRHPGLREHLIHGVFWKWQHYHLARTMLAVALPRRWWPLRWWLAAPYVNYLVDRRTGPILAPAIVAHDLTEMIACVRGAVRYRFPVI